MISFLCYFDPQSFTKIKYWQITLPFTDVINYAPVPNFLTLQIGRDAIPENKIVTKISEFTAILAYQLTPFMPKGFSYPYQLEESISKF